MTKEEFEAEKRRILGLYRPGANPIGNVEDFDHYLGLSELLLGVHISSTGNADCQVEARCWPIAPAPPVPKLVEEVERIWVRRLGYRGYEAHTVSVDTQAIVLDCLTVLGYPGSCRRDKGSGEYAPYYVAARIVVALLESPPDFAAERARLIAQRADSMHVKVLHLLEQGLSPNDRFPTEPLLTIAARFARAETMLLLFEHGADVHCTSSSGGTAIWSAVACGNHDAVRMLIDYGADIHTPNSKGDTVLMLAARNGVRGDGPRYLEVARLLIEAGANVQAQDRTRWAALTGAAAWGRTEVVELLLERGAARDPRDENGMTPLMHAGRNGHFDAVERLLSYGADRELRDGESKTARDHAVEMGHAKVVDKLGRYDQRAS